LVDSGDAGCAVFVDSRRDGYVGGQNRAEGSAAMTHVGEHAIVLGASLAGLAAAAALAERFDRVTIVERDTLPESAAACARDAMRARDDGVGVRAGWG
jgi:hypothetical protein